MGHRTDHYRPGGRTASGSQSRRRAASSPGRGLAAAQGPIALPVRHPDYPARSGLPDDARDRQDAQQRVRYGTGAAYTDAQPGSVLDSQGFATLETGSTFVRGSNTAWDAELAGGVLHAAGVAPRTVLRVDSPDRLVLTRPHTGPPLSQATYEIRRDPFGQLHDGLTRLVERGPSAGPMAGRLLLPTLDTGTLTAVTGSPEVTGRQTAWTDRFVGHALRIRLRSGRARFVPGSRYVFHDGQPWDDSVLGAILEVEGHTRPYRVHHLVAGRWAVLDRAVKADTATEHSSSDEIPGSAWHAGVERGFAIYERHAYRIAEVRSPSVLSLDRPYAGTTGTGKEYTIDARSCRRNGLAVMPGASCTSRISDRST